MKILKIVIFVLIFIFGLTGHILLARDLSIIPDSVSIILGRPTDNSITLNILSVKNMEIYFKYGPNSDDYEQQTNIFSLTKDEPYEMILDNLETDTRHFYSMYYRLPEQESFTISEEKIFHTQKQPNRSFTFAVHADPHLDEQSDTEVYNRCLSNTLADNPDFLIDLGDNFMSDKLVEQNVQEVVNRHLLLRSFYDNICHSIP